MHLPECRSITLNMNFMSIINKYRYLYTSKTDFRDTSWSGNNRFSAQASKSELVLMNVPCCCYLLNFLRLMPVPFSTLRFHIRFSAACVISELLISVFVQIWHRNMTANTANLTSLIYVSEYLGFRVTVSLTILNSIKSKEPK